MTRIGDFDIIRELARRSNAVTYVARRAGDAGDVDGRYCVKAIDPDALGLLESVAVGQTFVDRAKIQKRLVDQGAKHWAPVLDVGTPDAAYFVTELYPMTGERYVNRGTVAGTRQLYTVVWSVVRGLTELRESFRRAHGNLKLSNILIGGDPRMLSPKKSTVVLTDLSGDGQSARDRAGDLLAVGDLVHHLVLGRSFRPATPESLELALDTGSFPPVMPEWPVPMSAAWSRLGPDGPDWLDLCNWLLSPEPDQRPADLVEVAIALHRLVPKRRRLPRLRWVAAALLPLALGAVVGGVFRQAHMSVRQDLTAVHGQWFGQFEEKLSDPGRASRYAREDGLRTALDVVREAHRQSVHFEPSADPLLNYGSYKNVGTALSVIERVKRELSPDRFARLAAVEAAQRRYAARGWAQPAEFMGKLAAGTRPAPGADVAGGIDRLLAAWDAADVDKVDAEWAEFDAHVQVAEKSNDKVLTAFAEQLRSATAAGVRLNDDGFAGLDAMRARAPLAESLAKLATDGWPKGHGRERIAADLDIRLDLSNPSDDQIRQWLADIDQYALVKLDREAEPLKSLSADYKKLTDDVKKQSQLSEDEQATYMAERSAVEDKIAALSAAQFLKKDATRGEVGDIQARATAIRTGLDKLRRAWVRIDDPVQWAASIKAPLPSTSEALQRRWAAYAARQETRVDGFKADPNAFKRAKAEADRVKDALSALGKEFPLGADGLGERLAAIGFVKRETLLQELSAWAEAPADAAASVVVPDAESATKLTAEQGKQFVAWCEQLRELAKTFPLTKEVLTPADRPDQAWAKRDKAFWDDPIIKDYVQPDVERIEALAAVAAMPKAGLLKAAAEESKTEVALAAYKRLGELSDWPLADPDVDQEIELRRRTSGLISAVKSADDRAAATADWRAAGPLRWRRYANQAVLPKRGADPAPVVRRLAKAANVRNALLVTEADVDLLDPPARFNYALYLARTTLGDPADAVVRDTSVKLRRAIDRLGKRAEVAELGDRLGRVAEREPMSDDATLLAPQPPATYIVKDGNYELKFVRVEPPGQRPAYLCTTELSLGQFVELINTTGGNWSAANGMLGTLSTPGGPPPVPQRGPRMWARPAANNGPIERFDSWRFDTPAAVDQEMVFEPSFRKTKFNDATIKPELGDNPRHDHPMQQVPARAALYAAALLNCRLPTSREWLAAYEMEYKSAPVARRADWNLRDALWKRQAEFAAKDAPGQWPGTDSAGIFWPKGVAKPGGASVNPGDDGTVLFRLVDAGGGTFKNLVGNVAEFVCDRPDQFELAPDRKTPAGVTKFATAHEGQIMVIGGSALSPPELELLKPQPVTAATDPYADVGVRLAFTAPARSMAERLKWFLEEQEYLAAAVP